MFIKIGIIDNDYFYISNVVKRLLNLYKPKKIPDNVKELLINFQNYYLIDILEHSYGEIYNITEDEGISESLILKFINYNFMNICFFTGFNSDIIKGINFNQISIIRKWFNLLHFDNLIKNLNFF